MTDRTAARRGLAALVTTVTSAAMLSVWKGAADAAPARPHGEGQIRATFGGACNGYAQSHRTVWPHGSWSGNGGASTHVGHASLANEYNGARWWTHHGAGGDAKLNYGIGGFECRVKRGNPSQYSTHAWGIAVDTNTLCNPIGQDHWRGNGYSGPGRCDGPDYGTALPDVWKANNDMSRINFQWGLSWNDPHHFQYATGY